MNEQIVDENSEYIKARDKPDPEPIAKRIKQWWKEFKCNHYWYSERANPHSLGTFKSKCKKCGKTSWVTGTRIDEIKEIYKRF